MNKNTNVVDKSGDPVDLTDVQGKEVSFHLSDEDEEIQGTVTKISGDQIWVLLPERKKSKAYELKQLKFIEVLE